jgi:hypothetical protein
VSSPSADVIEELARAARRETEQAHAEQAEYLAGFTGGAAASAGDRDDGAALEAARAVLADRSEPADRRIDVLSRLGDPVLRLPGGVDTLLRIAADSGDDAAVRQAAVGWLGVAAFEVERFTPYLTAYVDVLRRLLDDPVAGLREAAVTTLAAEHDEVVQQVLADGLEGDGPLPVERNRAIELLAEDDHLDTLPWLRELYTSAAEGDRASAVRYMAVHPAAEDDIAQILQDRAETTAVRQQGAAALRALAPERFDAVAKEIVLDPDDDPGVRADCLQSLRVADGGAAVYGDPEFLEEVRAVSEETGAPDVASLAQQTLDDAPPS